MATQNEAVQKAPEVGAEELLRLSVRRGGVVVATGREAWAQSLGEERRQAQENRQRAERYGDALGLIAQFAPGPAREFAEAILRGAPATPSYWAGLHRPGEGDEAAD